VEKRLHNEELNPLSAELNPICHLLALLEAHPILHVSRIKVNVLYSSPYIFRVMKSRRMRWARHVARMEEKRRVYRVWVEKLEEKSLLGRPRRKWEDNI
jgi:transposase